MAIEDARFVLPNACDTKMIVTMNARSLQQLLPAAGAATAPSGRSGPWRRRCCAWSTPVAPRPLCQKRAAGCVAGPCPEGKMCCGEAEAVRDDYQALKEEASGQ